ncbi:MAG: lysozyme inhibitor LprI family protein [Rhizobiaceae bacterium]|nr:lysozyme inhibitor LprI family protein [Rhizobiaceae bacterium]
MKLRVQFFVASIIVMASLFGNSQAFECAKATTEVELAICASAKIHSADTAMEKAYFALVDKLDKKTAKSIQAEQREWLKYRATVCGAGSECLLEETENRANAIKDNAARTPPMLPVFLRQIGSSNTYNLKFEGSKFTAPSTNGQIAYNQAIERLIKEMPFNEVSDDQGMFSYEQETNVTVTWQSDKLISAIAYTYDYSGGAHPNSWTTAINIDLQQGTPLKTGDLFPPQAIQTLIADCRDLIIELKSGIYDEVNEESRARIDEDYPGVIKKHIADMTRWTFNETGATVTFDSYAIGPYAAGPHQCEFTAEYLLKLADNPDLLQQ